MEVLMTTLRTALATFGLTLGLTFGLPAAADTWQVDPTHSQVGFEVDHMMISTVRGDFGTFSGTAETDQKGKLTALSGSVTVGSVDTDDQKRDSHLQSADFFDAATFPEMTFTSKKVTPQANGGYVVVGDLTIRGVTKSVSLELGPLKGPVKDGWGNTKVGTVAKTTINRQDFGVTWNKSLDAGGVVVGDDVRITLDLQLAQKLPEQG
jgi:polyisoprenoid-binding protein YceI